jgi:hypothetical protein
MRFQLFPRVLRAPPIQPPVILSQVQCSRAFLTATSGSRVFLVAPFHRWPLRVAFACQQTAPLHALAARRVSKTVACLSGRWVKVARARTRPLCWSLGRLQQPTLVAVANCPRAAVKTEARVNPGVSVHLQHGNVVKDPDSCCHCSTAVIHGSEGFTSALGCARVGRRSFRARRSCRLPAVTCRILFPGARDGFRARQKHVEGRVKRPSAFPVRASTSCAAS